MRFLNFDAMRDHRREDEVSEQLSQLIFHIFTYIIALHSGEDESADFEPWVIEKPGDLGDRGLQLSQPRKREDPGIDGDVNILNVVHHVDV